MPNKKIITEYGRLWPREVFDLIEDGKLMMNSYEALQNLGVYILFRNDLPYYVGRATKTSLYKRLHDHSNKATDKHFNFWNYFSFFVVPNKNHINEIEGILIASMPTANRSVPLKVTSKIPKNITNNLKKIRQNK